MSNAYEADLVQQAFVADGDLEDYQYCPVEMNSDEEIILASDAGDFMLGVLQNTPDEAGKTARVAVGGITIAKGGESFDAGSKIQVGAGGTFVEQTTGTLAGIAVTSCGGANQYFSLKIARDSGV